jgi:hypothetical protein
VLEPSNGVGHVWSIFHLNGVAVCEANLDFFRKTVKRKKKQTKNKKQLNDLI